MFELRGNSSLMYGNGNNAINSYIIIRSKVYLQVMFCIACALFVTFTFWFFREGEDWNRMRKALAPKMLRPKDVRDNMDNFTAVTRDAIEHMVSIRGIDMEIPDLDKELAKWATECKCLLLSRLNKTRQDKAMFYLKSYTVLYSILTLSK